MAASKPALSARNGTGLTSDTTRMENDPDSIMATIGPNSMTNGQHSGPQTAKEHAPPLPDRSPNLMPCSLSRDPSLNSDQAALPEDWDLIPERVTLFDVLDNLALPQTLESWQQRLARQTSKVRLQQAKLKQSTALAKDKVVEEWRRRVSTPDEQLAKYKKRMRESVDRLGHTWNDARNVTLREKLAFIAGVFNIFISGYLIGALPQSYYLWYTAQLLYFMPIRYYSYRKRGYHYFMADMCYFVNFLLLLFIWAFPQSKRLFIGTYCLAYGNNAVAIAMWRNSMVFHSLDKVTSLFIHIMPPVTLHCLLHLTPGGILASRFPAIHAIKHSSSADSFHFNLVQMIGWSSVPYAIWQLSYHFFITVRRREKIAAGRPTSFTWLKKSYGGSWIGRIVLGLPEPLQETGFMLTQYLYALSSMLPAPIWFWHRWPSAAFLICLFGWSIYNGATYYIDVFGNRFQKELEQMKRDVAKWQLSPNGPNTPSTTPRFEADVKQLHQRNSSTGASRSEISFTSDHSTENIPPLDINTGSQATSASASLESQHLTMHQRRPARDS